MALWSHYPPSQSFCHRFIEKTPRASIFEAFPVVVLRLLRLLRVFRLARSLPRLRSIVEALISGFSSVGWICVLILVYQYIAGCLCMLIFQANDPFHFGNKRLQHGFWLYVLRHHRTLLFLDVSQEPSAAQCLPFCGCKHLIPGIKFFI